jgi:PAS domain S-box-containing protein
MRNSIVYKTALSVSAALMIVMVVLGLYIYTSQANIIEQLQNDKKQTILKYLNQAEENAIDQELDTLEGLSNSLLAGISNALYNSDIDTGKELVTQFLDNSSIKLITIYDTSIDEIFLCAYMQDDKIKYATTEPKKLKKLEFFKFNMKVEDEDIGYFKVYYDTKEIIKDIQNTKKQEIALFNKRYKEINQEIKQKLINQAIGFMFAGILVTILIIYLLKKFVNQPLVKFQVGLNSFFRYLSDPSQKVTKIEINTKDEFGQMSKSVNESIQVSMKMHGEMAQLMHAMDKNVITTETDKKGIITRVSQAFCKISGYTKEELIGKPHNIVRHPDMPKEVFKNMWDTLKKGKIWEGEVKNLKKDGGFYWVHAIISPKCTKAGGNCGYTVIRYDITDKKAVEELTANLEIKIQERTKELNSEKKLINSIVNSQDSIVVTSDGKTLKTINKAFKDFYELETIEEFEDKYGPCICDSYEKDVPDDYLKKDMNGTSWVNYMLDRPGEKFKVMIKKGEKYHTFSISLDSFIFEEQKFVTVVLNDITELEESKKQVEAIHKHTRESIEYASLIQSAVIAQSEQLKPYFKDSFVTWTPKDTVGGDIWLFNDLRHEDECILMFIDCTGHGVPGAFVTMIVKAVEREIVGKIIEDPDMDVSPAWVMGYFNKTMKILLKQENKDSLSNAGFDGGIIYYNKREQILKFAGAETPLFYITPDGEFKTIKGNRYSVGYKKCDMNYEYKESIIEVQEGMKFYCTTDGYLDQNGGPKDFPFGKKRFGNIIKENYKEPMAEIQTIFQYEMMDWEEQIPNNIRNDDMTVIGFEIGKKSDYKTKTTQEIVKYEGVMTQNVIATSMDNIEAKITNMSMLGTVSTITIEYCQNMMNYSKNEEEGSREIVPAGVIEVQYINNEYYEIIATNIVSIEDKEKIEPKLIEIQGLDKAGIKKRYRELRKSGQNSHEKGGGIGLYEIAKVSDGIEYNFKPINEDKYYFTMSSIVKPKEKKVRE